MRKIKFDLTDDLIQDLSRIHQRGLGDLSTLTNLPVLITGATGFIGTWLTLSWVYSRAQIGGRGHLFLTSRHPEAIHPLINQIDPTAPVSFIPNDIRSVEFPALMQGGLVIHAATPASAKLNAENPEEMLSTIIDGQKQVLSEVQRTCVQRVLFTSSGAVYGPQPFYVLRLDEDWQGGPNVLDRDSAYHEGKRVAELLGVVASSANNYQFISARLFAFMAPFMQMNAHFAAGNFIMDAVEGRDIVIKSGGGSIRSYQYATDMCTAIWGLAKRGEDRNAYNVGSEEAITIRDLARQIQQIVNPNVEVRIQGKDNSTNVSRYVPSIRRLESLLGFSNETSLNTMIRKTASWYDASNGI